MADYGLTDQGFVIKRLQQILTEQRAKAVELFQDLVVSGDTVDTSDSSLLGRLITLDADGDSDLWELGQQVYSSFDPNSATGVALDNLTTLSYISRKVDESSVVDLSVVGTPSTIIPQGKEVGAIDTGTTFTLNNSETLSNSSCTGAAYQITVQDNTAYTIFFSLSGSLVGTTVSITSGFSTTAETIANQIIAAFALHTQLPLVWEASSGLLWVRSVDPFIKYNFDVSVNLVNTKVKSTVKATATVVGPLEQSINTVSNILTPVLGWDSVTNEVAATLGRYKETDEELRIRFRNTKFERAVNNVESLYSAINSITGVESFAIYENDTSVVDSNGLPAHSFMAIVEGGLTSEIAENIWQNKPAGIQSAGDTPVTIEDSNGFPRVIYFKRPNLTNIYINMTLIKFDDFPANGDDLIRTALTSYVDGLRLGQDLVFSRLYTPINSVTGHQVTSLTVGTSPNPTGTANITIPFDGVATALAMNIGIS